ncbi:pimeloyl-ACP methyl ester carboxylesterase [Actinoplanes lutulentus]|uniref:Prolyl oligopeptidase family protein n=1 Tax=Actinoplanes lutulentus TaxID=1287878 RepID=A0A327ZKG4_9ACTN|nr:prolyl oligopeptidase family serine peptidase [Actinoplanes lutulentus]MBB2944261.1 pimeloyl-ACP methyl ester carboxylesterase [Actinoplanes lutulentus]RAK42506.1 prolyl oligopeptidase family protein [Actinoplanes lutulentus]
MIGRSALALALLLPVALAPAPALAAPVACQAPPPGKPGYVVADPACNIDGTPFAALPDAKIWTGIKDGAAYRIERPKRWNGQLVVYAHGFRGNGTTVFVDNPALRAHYIERGFAWAASSYATNGYDVSQGVTDTHALIDVFRQATGAKARKVYITGASMGGHVTAVAIEKYPRTFTGAMPTCGVLGDVELFDYFLDTTVTAAALAETDVDFPASPQFGAQLGKIIPALGVTTGLTDAGRTWSNVVERRSGGERPGFDAALAYWNAAAQGGVPFLFSFYPSLTAGSVDNRHTLYRSTDARRLTATEKKLNADVLRVRRTTTADVPVVAGKPRIPVLSLHGIGDLFVPFSMEQYYARESHGRNFVSRAIRDVTHCGFTQPELRQGFDDLVRWVETGRRPAGDAILDRRTVAAATFGCRFTIGVRGNYAPCGG